MDCMKGCRELPKPPKGGAFFCALQKDGEKVVPFFPTKPLIVGQPQTSLEDTENRIWAGRHGSNRRIVAALQTAWEKSAHLLQLNWCGGLLPCVDRSLGLYRGPVSQHPAARPACMPAAARCRPPFAAAANCAACQSRVDRSHMVHAITTTDPCIHLSSCLTRQSIAFNRASAKHLVAPARVAARPRLHHIRVHWRRRPRLLPRRMLEVVCSRGAPNRTSM